MQFCLKGLDGSDSEAAARRQAARPAHLAMAEKLKMSGNLLMAAAIKNENDAMVGSLMIFEFPSKEELDIYLEREPYMSSGVWKEIEIHTVAVSPIFLGQSAGQAANP